jgi:hypothetical protein
MGSKHRFNRLTAAATHCFDSMRLSTGRLSTALLNFLWRREYFQLSRAHSIRTMTMTVVGQAVIAHIGDRRVELNVSYLTQAERS